MARWWRPVVGLLWLAFVAFVTLRPGDMSSEQVARISHVCLLCGSRGTADAIVNVLLFAPLGFALAGTRRTGELAAALLVGLAASISIELIQSQLPGRHSSPADVLWNTIGAGVGWLVYGAARTRIEGGSKGVAMVLAFLVAGWFFVAGLLMIPVPPGPESMVEWTPAIASMPSYDGEIVAATLDGAPLLPGRTLGARDLLVGDWTLETTIRAGTTAERPSPLLGVIDRKDVPSVLLAVHGEDLLLHRSRMAGRLRFDDPGMRAVGALKGVEPDDTIVVRVRTNAESTCLSSSGSGEFCASGLRLARTWGLLLSLGRAGPRLRQAIDLVWLAVLFVPLGFWAGTVAEIAAAGSIGLIGGLLAVASTRLMMGPWYGVIACLFGVLGGLALRVASQRIGGVPSPQRPTASSMASSV